jgi:hypothetical protein
LRESAEIPFFIELVVVRMGLAEAKVMQRIALLASLVACSQSVPPKPTSPASRGLRADQHLDAARDHARRAEELARWPDRHNDVATYDAPNSGLWYRAWDQAKDERRISDVHQGAAAQLQAEYDAACAQVADDAIRISPLARFGRGGMPTSDGVVVFLSSDAGPADRLLASLRCHRAWMMLSQNTGMEACPLDLPGLRIEVHGDPTGISVELHVRDEKLVPEVQQRAARELETANQARTAL